ncbi:MAG: DUF5063 domain-containing protein [Porphyromonas sp.]|nr:DUF5063 domain-containing protein [Porphyromonas sp.]
MSHSHCNCPEHSEKHIETEDATLYTSDLLRFAAAGVDFCGVVEQARNLSLSEFINYLCPLLPKLYTLGWELGNGYDYDPEYDFIPTYVSEKTYLSLQERLERILGAYDTFVDIPSRETQLNDVPSLVRLSELLCDIYQPVGDLLGILKERNESALLAAVAHCKNQFAEFWGDNCLIAARALHRLRFSSIYETILEDEEQGSNSLSQEQEISSWDDFL